FLICHSLLRHPLAILELYEFELQSYFHCFQIDGPAMLPLSYKYIVSGLLAIQLAIAPPLLDAIDDSLMDQAAQKEFKGSCRKTSVAILGAGMAGIAAAQS